MSAGEEGMRILAFSDLHCDAVFAAAIVAASRQADVVVGAGDFARQQRGLAGCIEDLSGVAAPLILVPGNHDDAEEMRCLAADHANIHVLHGQAVAIAGQRFLGLGYEIPRLCGERWSRSLEENQADQLLSMLRSDDVLVTHTPPHGIVDRQRDGRHEGSRAIRRAVTRAQPRLHLCGHIHNSWGLSDRLGNTLVCNLGPAPRLFQLAAQSPVVERSLDEG